MARMPRTVVPGLPLHILQRSTANGPCFFFESDCRSYLVSLRDAARRYGCHIHAYVLMSRGVQLLLTPEDERSASLLLQSVGSSYVKHVNASYRRRGTLWQGRYRSAVVEPERFLLACSRFIETAPVRAGIVPAPGLYPWSSYRANGDGRVDELLSPHPLYLALGDEPAARCAVYRNWVAGGDESEQRVIRRAVESGAVLGEDAFRRRIENRVRRSLVRLEHGGDRRSAAFRRGQRDRLFWGSRVAENFQAAEPSNAQATRTGAGANG